MAKKLIISGLIVVLIGALSLGIYNWTQNNGTARAGQGTGYANGEGQDYRGGRSGNEVTPGSAEQGQSYGRVQAGDLAQGSEAYSLHEPEPQPTWKNGLLSLGR
jgi:hypothetical protein